MTGYDSPIGKKQFQGQPMREVTIPDETGYTPQNTRPQTQQFQLDEAALRDFNARFGPPEAPLPSQEQTNLEQQFREAREAKRLGRERLNEAAKRRIEMLLGMTRTTRQFDINGNKFTLRTLRSEELRDAIVSATTFDGSVQSPFEIRKQLLARSLVQIAGMDSDQFFASQEIESKLIGVDQFDHYLLGRIYDEYLTMVREAQEKYSIKNEQEAKEVMEDLKK